MRRELLGLWRRFVNRLRGSYVIDRGGYDEAGWLSRRSEQLVNTGLSWRELGRGRVTVGDLPHVSSGHLAWLEGLNEEEREAETERWLRRGDIPDPGMIRP